MAKGPVPGRTLALGLAFSVVAPWSCSLSAPQGTSTPRSDWLAQTGFFVRRSWPSARLHLSKSELGYSGRLSDLLRDLEEIRIRPPSPGGFGIEQLQASGDQMCQVHVYMNGNRTSPHPAGDRVNLDDIFPRQVIDGLEFHAGPEGPVFQDDGCGSLLLWSQDLRLSNDRPFHGSIEGAVLTSSANPVTRVQLEPVRKGQVPRTGGTFSFLDLLPGEYELVFSTRSGPITRLKLRVFAFRRSRIDLEVGKDPGDRGWGSETRD